MPKEPGESQRELGIEREASYIVSVINPKKSKRQYPCRFNVFLDFLKLEGTMNEQAKQFLLNTKNNPQWTE